MCLTIPKKVIFSDKNSVLVSAWNSDEKQEVPTIVNVKKNDWVLTQNGIIIEKISKKQAEEIINLLK